MADAAHKVPHNLSAVLAQAGFRLTKQRKLIFEILQSSHDHPTGADVFLRAKEKMDGISLATVYNCLETLTEAGVVKSVHCDRSASRYCSNLREHAHLFCEVCGMVMDIFPSQISQGIASWDLPQGCEIREIDVALKGACPQCRQSTSVQGEA